MLLSIVACKGVSHHFFPSKRMTNEALFLKPRNPVILKIADYNMKFQLKRAL